LEHLSYNTTRLCFILARQAAGDFLLSFLLFLVPTQRPVVAPVYEEIHSTSPDPPAGGIGAGLFTPQRPDANLHRELERPPSNY